ncbi:hypothetical protein [Methylomagnum sp.]
MKKMPFILGLLIPALTATPVTADASQAQAIVGSWKITAQVPVGAPICPGPNPCTVIALATAMSDRTIIQSAAVPNVSEGHGAWSKRGNRFTIRSAYFRLDANGQAIGTSETTTEITLKKNQNEGSGQFTNRVYDLQGNEITSFSGQATATRILPP